MVIARSLSIYLGVKDFAMLSTLRVLITVCMLDILVWRLRHALTHVSHACAVFSSGVSLEVTLAVLVITTIPIVLEARKTLEKERGKKEGDDFRALPFL